MLLKIYKVEPMAVDCKPRRSRSATSGAEYQHLQLQPPGGKTMLDDAKKQWHISPSFHFFFVFADGS